MSSRRMNESIVLFDFTYAWSINVLDVGVVLVGSVIICLNLRSTMLVESVSFSVESVNRLTLKSPIRTVSFTPFSFCLLSVNEFIV